MERAVHHYRAKMQAITNIRLWEPTADCCICGEETLLTHAVAYCCEPTHDEIGSESKTYPGHIVGGMPACKRCHDLHYGVEN
jgi:hypothetical protein